MSQSSHDKGCGCGCGVATVPLEAVEVDWASMPDVAIVCGCAQVDKKTIIEAIGKGAYTLPLLKIMTGAGQGSDCEQTNPRRRPCQADLQALLEIYSQQKPLGGCCS